MINELFQIVSYSYQPRRPRNQNKNGDAGPQEEKQAAISATSSPGPVKDPDKNRQPDEQNLKNVVPVNTEKSLFSQLEEIIHTEQQDSIETSTGRAGENEDSGFMNDLLELNEEDKSTVEQLQKRDMEVKQHEQAHLAAAGQFATGVSYTYQTGPDGKRYAVGGHVDIDSSEVPDDPDATISKARTIRRAANAPAAPSAQDRAVSVAASRMETKARIEKIQKILEDNEETSTKKIDLAMTAYGQNGFNIGKTINQAV